MPVHDWSRVDAWLFHDFRHSWVEELNRALNARVLPPDHYALTEQHAAGFGPVRPTRSPGPLRLDPGEESEPAAGSATGRRVAVSGHTLPGPRLEVSAETEMEFYRRKQSVVAVRHVSGDRVVAVIEVVSPANKGSRAGIEAFVRKAAELLDRRIHLLILDLIPPGPRDPRGIHARIWEDLDGTEPTPPERPLTLAAYEADLTTRAYVVPVAVGDALPDMPLFLAPRACVEVPLEETYRAAFEAFPRRWRAILEADPSGAEPGRP